MQPLLQPMPLPELHGNSRKLKDSRAQGSKHSHPASTAQGGLLLRRKGPCFPSAKGPSGIPIPSEAAAAPTQLKRVCTRAVGLRCVAPVLSIILACCPA